MRERTGFTLVEVMIALVILSLVILGMAATTGSFVRVVAESDRMAAAVQLADDRIEQVQMDPNYGGLDSLYAGVESNFPTLAGFTRETRIVRVGGAGQPVDYKKVTVIVAGPGLPTRVERTVSVAAP